MVADECGEEILAASGMSGSIRIWVDGARWRASVLFKSSDSDQTFALHGNDSSEDVLTAITNALRSANAKLRRVRESEQRRLARSVLSKDSVQGLQETPVSTLQSGQDQVV